ncbi:hypothetical protein FACS1894164_21280 [Spirochaetia bacterium]|nr:hypothetical protein FACS1894164_21280 [Spirochaetia bacterium]
MEMRRSEFSRHCGVSDPAIAKAIKTGTVIINSAGMVDPDNTINIKYWEKQRRAGKVAVSRSAKTKDIPHPGKTPEVYVDDYELAERAGVPRRLLKMTLRELVSNYRDIENIRDYVKILRDLTASDEKEIKIQERRSQLIEKDYVVAQVFQYLDVLMRQLLEFPESVADGIVSSVQSQGLAARHDVISTLGKGLARIISDSKDHITKSMTGLRSKYQEVPEDRLEEIEETLEEIRL